jgi:hypothetical protein
MVLFNYSIPKVFNNFPQRNVQEQEKHDMNETFEQKNKKETYDDIRKKILEKSDENIIKKSENIKPKIKRSARNPRKK